MFEALTKSVPSADTLRYLDFLLGAAPRAFQAKLEELMKAVDMDIRQLLKEEFEARSREDGRAKGKAEGKAEGRAEAIRAVLAARQITVGASQTLRIQAEANLATLDLWLRRAVDATRCDDLFR